MGMKAQSIRVVVGNYVVLRVAVTGGGADHQHGKSMSCFFP